jgi:transcription antitermination factor NusG
MQCTDRKTLRYTGALFLCTFFYSFNALGRWGIGMSVYVVEVYGGAELQAKKVIAAYIEKTGFTAIRAIHVISKEVQRVKGNLLKSHIEVLTPGYVFLEVDDSTQPTNPTMKLTEQLYYFIKSITEFFPRMKKLDDKKRMSDEEFFDFLHLTQGDTEVQVEITTEPEETKKEITHTVNTTADRNQKKTGFHKLDRIYMSALHRIWDRIQALLADGKKIWFTRQEEKTIFSFPLSSLQHVLTRLKRDPLIRSILGPALSVVLASSNQIERKRGDTIENNDVSDRETQLRRDPL